jgi:hypothetical protein
VLALAGLACSAVATAAIPAVMPPAYSWVGQTTSEAAAQGLPGAWLSRLGFLLLGLSVLLLAAVRRPVWGSAGTWCHAGFGVFMTAAAAFSNRPWQPADTFDRTEDFLHSLSATAMGFAFAAGVVTAGLLRGDRDLRLRILDLLAVVASVGLPLGMSAAPATDGLLQRAMFAIAYVWYGVEAVRAIQDRRAQMKGPGSRSAPDSGPEPARSGHP